jgi:hypothetical protein
MTKHPASYDAVFARWYSVLMDLPCIARTNGHTFLRKQNIGSYKLRERRSLSGLLTVQPHLFLQYSRPAKIIRNHFCKEPQPRLRMMERSKIKNRNHDEIAKPSRSARAMSCSPRELIR